MTTFSYLHRSGDTAGGIGPPAGRQTEVRMLGKLAVGYLLRRGSEGSTWVGLLMMASAAGLALTGDQSTALVDLALAVVGAAKAFMPDGLYDPGR